MGETLREAVDREAAALPSPLPQARFGTRTLSDALETAAFFDRHFLPGAFDGRPLPGLRDAGLPEPLGARIRLVVEDLGELNTALLPEGSAYPAAPLLALVTRGHALLRWRARKEPPFAPKVGELLRKNGRLRRSGQLAIALGDALRLARADADRLAALQGVDPKFVEQAEATLQAFRDWQRPDRGAAVARRVRLAALLQTHVSDILDTVDVVFRDFPHLRREARGAGVLDAAAASARSRRERKSGATPADPTET